MVTVEAYRARSPRARQRPVQNPETNSKISLSPFDWQDAWSGFLTCVPPNLALASRDETAKSASKGDGNKKEEHYPK